MCNHLLISDILRYGGPQSQMVDLKFSRDWHDYLACGLQYIIVVVDGRGTGFKGRKLRNPVKDNLGFWETKDQINAARSVCFIDLESNLFIHPQGMGREEIC
jgi:dipeptidyl aminopeptidase/acylaminoacyl peptidase